MKITCKTIRQVTFTRSGVAYIPIAYEGPTSVCMRAHPKKERSIRSDVSGRCYRICRRCHGRWRTQAKSELEQMLMRANVKAAHAQCACKLRGVYRKVIRNRTIHKKAWNKKLVARRGDYRAICMACARAACHRSGWLKQSSYYLFSITFQSIDIR